jgi:sarcosine reductase
VVTAGNANEIIKLPPMKKVIGHIETVDVIAGGFKGSLKEDGSIEAELQVITGSTNELGYNLLSATTI